MDQNKKDKAFLLALQSLKHSYFNANGFTERANLSWAIKVMVLVSLTLLFYISLYFIEGLPIYFLLLFAYSICSASLILNVIHDASHNAVFANKKSNEWIRNMAFFILGNSPHLWWQEHVIDHHPVPNIIGEDLAIIETPVLRFHAKQNWQSYHRFQHFYAPVLYCLHMTDFYFYSEYQKVFHLFEKKKDKTILYWFAVSKIFHFLFLLVLPMCFHAYSMLTILFGFFFIQMIHSWILIYCLGVSHLNDKVPFYSNKNILKARGWVACQVETAVDYGVHSPVLTAMVGGFNLHIIHHLLPGISHVHLSALMPEFKKLCHQYGYDYKACSHFELLQSHFRLLKNMGNNKLTDKKQVFNPNQIT